MMQKFVLLKNQVEYHWFADLDCVFSFVVFGRFFVMMNTCDLLQEMADKPKTQDKPWEVGER